MKPSVTIIWKTAVMAPDSPKILSHNHYCISDIWMLKWLELGSKAQNFEKLFIHVASDHKLYINGKQSCITIK